MRSSILIKCLSPYINIIKSTIGKIGLPIKYLEPGLSDGLFKKRNKKSDHLATRETDYNVFYSALKIEYINKIHSQGGIKNSLFQFCLTISKPFPPIYLEEMKNVSAFHEPLVI